ncbi:MAG: hypothetical protein ABW003_21395, partial [Microvirga sp.]
ITQTTCSRAFGSFAARSGGMTGGAIMSAVCHRLTPGHRRRANLAALGLYDTTEPHPKLEPILKSQGVDYKAIVGRTGPLCLRRALIDEATFEIDDDLGEPAFVMAVHDVDALSVVDLIAWPIWHPGDFATYFGFAAVLGGDAAVNPASFVDEPCPIWSTPLSLLQADLRGCVVLDPRLAAPILRQAPAPFQCEDVGQAQWLVDTGAIAVSELLVPARRAVA